MRRLAIIPARGGSKRIPRKNMKHFLGKPIIAYSIETALSSGLFDEVMVSTDDSEIAAIALEYGAKVPFFRSETNSNDFSTTYDVIEEVIVSYRKQDQAFEYACCIYPTAPLVTSLSLTSGFDLLDSNHYDSVFPVMKFSYPIQRALKIDKHSKISLFEPDHMNSRSQDLETAYHDAGQFYWLNTKVLLEKRKLWTDNTGVIIINELEGQDIDTFDDWKLAELKYQLLNG